MSEVLTQTLRHSRVVFWTKRNLFFPPPPLLISHTQTLKVISKAVTIECMAIKENAASPFMITMRHFLNVLSLIVTAQIFYVPVSQPGSKLR